MRVGDEYTGSNLQGLAREVAAYRAAMKEVDSDDAPCEYRGTEHFAWASGWNAAIEHLRQAADGG